MHQVVYSSLSHSAHSAQAKTNGPLSVYRKRQYGLVDVWAQHRDFHAARLVHEERHLLDVVHVVGQNGGHVFGWEIGLEVSSLVGHPGVASRVGFVEGIGGKRFPVFPNFIQNKFRVVALLAPLQKLGLQFGQECRVLLSHGLAQNVGLAFGKSSKLLR